jgi:sodium/potassium/calcium exchanger 6
VVGIDWISTIASEVVRVLKAFGIILGISDAILGLTIFAVGNSLGDLVADVAVARLGYPVMAVSACFGGPIFNILFGIGISGLYGIITAAKLRHEQHQDQPFNYASYQIKIGGPLIVSGATLFCTLVGLLVVVPLNNWTIDRKIAWGLIIFWSCSTLVNLVIEVTGVF